MSIEDFLEDKAYTKELDDKVQAAFSDYADKARNLINQYLRRIDYQKYLVFNGEACDHHMELGEMYILHTLVCDIIKAEESGKTIPAHYTENIIRTSLGLGLATIKGGKA